MASAAVGEVAFYNPCVAPSLVRVGDMVRSELSEHRTPPRELFIGVRVVGDKPTFPCVEVLELRIQFSVKKCLLIMEVS